MAELTVVNNTRRAGVVDACSSGVGPQLCLVGERGLERVRAGEVRFLFCLSFYPLIIIIIIVYYYCGILDER